MSVLIDREQAIDAICDFFGNNDGTWSDEKITILMDAGIIIANLPSAQPEIIACGDCKHWICHDRRCGYWNHGVKPLEWCCHAERREDEQNT